MTNRDVGWRIGPWLLICIWLFPHSSHAILSPLYYTSATGNVVLDLSDAPGGQVEWFMWQLGFDGFLTQNFRPITDSAFAQALPNFVMDIKFANKDSLVLIPAGAYDLGNLMPAGLTPAQAFEYFGPYPHENNSRDVITAYGTPTNQTHGFGLVYDGDWLGANQDGIGDGGSSTGGVTPPSTPPPTLPGVDPPEDLDYADSVSLLYDPSNGHVSFDSSGPDGGYVVGYGLRSPNGTLRYPLFEPISEGLSNANVFAVEEISSDAIPPGIHDLGALLAPGLSERAVAESLRDSFFISIDDYFSDDFSINRVQSPFDTLTSSGTSVTLRILTHNAIPSFHNGSVGSDVDNDGLVVPLDAMLVINELNAGGGRELPVLGDEDPWPTFFYDVNEDGWISPIDALHVINVLDQLINVNGTTFTPTGVPEPNSGLLIPLILAALARRCR